MLSSQGFDLWADGYDASVGLSDEENSYPFAGYKQVLGTIYRAIRMQADCGRVLDLGFGTGTLAHRLYQDGYEITGVDFSPRMIRLAQEKMPEAHLFCCDFSQGLPENLGRFDAIVSTYALHHLSDEAKAEQTVMISAVEKIMDLTMKSINGDTEAPKEVEPLDQVIDKLQNDLRARHIMRLQKSECTIELGFVLSDMLTSLERISGHCANVAGCIMEISQYSLGLHEHTHSLKGEDSGYAQSYAQYAAQFKL